MFFFFIKDSKDQTQISFLVGKTFAALKSSRRIIVRAFEVKKQFKMFQMYAQVKRRQNAEEILEETTGHDRFYQKERSRYFVYSRRSEIRPLESCQKNVVPNLEFFKHDFSKKKCLCPYVFLCARRKLVEV